MASDSGRSGSWLPYGEEGGREALDVGLGAQARVTAQCFELLRGQVELACGVSATEQSGQRWKRPVVVVDAVEQQCGSNTLPGTRGHHRRGQVRPRGVAADEQSSGVPAELPDVLTSPAHRERSIIDGAREPVLGGPPVVHRDDQQPANSELSGQPPVGPTASPSPNRHHGSTRQSGTVRRLVGL